jgi:hypothetical protein
VSRGSRCVCRVCRVCRACRVSRLGGV